MTVIQQIIDFLNGSLWNYVLPVALLGLGIYLTLGLRGITFTHIGFAFRQLFGGRKAGDRKVGDRKEDEAEYEGEISPFNALMTAMSATVGTGNIAGVATAVGIGGPGALFWMWCTALVGMATKYAEAVLAVHYRETDELGQKVGGPMYYIRNGLGERWRWLAFLFALFGAFAGFGLANTVQSNTVAQVLGNSFNVPPTVTGVVLAVLVAAVILGGIKRIAHVAGVLVPFMALGYIIACIAVLVVNMDAIPDAIVLIFKSAFSPVAATGGFAGAAVMVAIRMGVARGIFSNEAGLGSAPIAHAAATTNSPVRQGSIAMLGTFLDTIVICSLTGLVLVSTGVWSGSEQGAVMTAQAFQQSLPYGDKIVTICLVLFAFTTMLGWSYYGERCAEYLLGPRVILPFRLLWVAGIFIGTQLSLKMVWDIADVLNGLMALPNLLALLLLSPVVFRLTRVYFAKQDNE